MALDSGKLQAKQGIESVRHSDWLEWLTRIGFACKGVVYFLIGALALMAAFAAHLKHRISATACARSI